MTQGGKGSSKHILSPYDEAMDALSSLITNCTRADNNNTRDRFELMVYYLKMLELEEQNSMMKVIHVAGTKGKGSTCTFTEAILRSCGFHTGFSHLLISLTFEKDFVWIDNDIPMPTYFRFLSLLAFKMFEGEQVDVILEVGLGGKFDATNVVQSPVVCGISSLGYDHMENLGVHFKEAQFVPSLSVYNNVGPSSLPPNDSQFDVSWQLTLQRLNEHILRGEKGGSKSAELTSDSSRYVTERCVENSVVFSSLPLAIKWLRDNVIHNHSARYQVLVTGSLHLVGTEASQEVRQRSSSYTSTFVPFCPYPLWHSLQKILDELHLLTS